MFLRQMTTWTLCAMVLFLLLVMTSLAPAAPAGSGHSGSSSRPYDFSYSVQDAPSGNDFGHEERSDGTTVRGRYHVLLPDGRRQTVTYVVDPQSGYVATVKYEQVGFNPTGSNNNNNNNSGHRSH